MMASVQRKFLYSVEVTLLNRLMHATDVHNVHFEEQTLTIGLEVH